MQKQTTAERVSSILSDAVRGLQRRISIRIHGNVESDTISACLRSGAVEEIRADDEIVDMALVQLPCDEAELARAAWLGANAVLTFDPREYAPVEARRAALRWWPEIQPWVFPLDGPDAFSCGVIACSPSMQAGAPRFSATMPVNLEEHDVERVLASFFPVAQEWVVGVDVKSTDGTLGIVERYADEVFRFDIQPWSFAEARNRCIDRCAYPWVFMTEGHEHLDPGSIAPLRNVGAIGLDQGVVMVVRDTGGGDPNAGEQFSFPWIFRNHPELRFVDQNGVHNALQMDGYAESIEAKGPVCVRLPGVIRTYHKAHETNRQQRHEQRLGMNRDALDATADAGGPKRGRALFYAAQEHASAGDLRTAIRRMVAYLREGDTFHEQVYEAYFRLGEYLYHLQKPRLAASVLRHGIPFDLKRCEIELLMADCYVLAGDDETARQLYAKAAGVPLPHHSTMFIRNAHYRSLPWLGLSMCCHRLGERGKAANAAQACLSFDAGNETARKILADVGAA